MEENDSLKTPDQYEQLHTLNKNAEKHSEFEKQDNLKITEEMNAIERKATMCVKDEIETGPGTDETNEAEIVLKNKIIDGDQ